MIMGVRRKMPKELLSTLCGKKIHYVGVGVCGLGVYQVEIEWDVWRIGKREGDVIMMFGSREIYDLELEATSND